MRKLIGIFVCCFIFQSLFNGKPVFAAKIPFTVILDAGHGGEDGGAVASDGTTEKTLNLQIAKKSACFFDIFGIPFAATREKDISVCDEGLHTIRERKISDIHNRFRMINETPGSVLLSIHMNYYPVEKYSGAQVFFAPGAPGSEEFANCIQQHFRELLQPDNKRNVKASTGTIYLLDKAERPSVLVECGFMSNTNELELLKESTYQSKVAYLLARSVIAYSGELKENYGTE